MAAAEGTGDTERSVADDLEGKQQCRAAIPAEDREHDIGRCCPEPTLHPYRVLRRGADRACGGRGPVERQRGFGGRKHVNGGCCGICGGSGAPLPGGLKCRINHASIHFPLQ